MRYKTHWLMTAVLTGAMFATFSTANSADIIVVSSYEPPPKTLNGFVQIQPETKVSNQFTLYPGLSPDQNSIDQIKILFDPSTTTDDLANLTVSINNEVLINGLFQPGNVVQVNNPSPPPATFDLIFNQLLGTTEVMIDNKRFLEVTYAIGTGVNQVFPPAETTEKVNYWLVISNASKTNKVGWAKTASDDPIFNTSGSASINPNTLNFTNGIGWQKPSPGDGNQIMLFSLVHAPEPSTYVLGTIVAGVLALTARNPRFRRIHGRGENEGDSEALANSAEAAQVV